MDEPDARVELLGPLRLVVGGDAVEVPGPKRRAVLALLALAEGRTVTVDQLVDALWPTEPPHAARQALHTHISRLRAGLGPVAAGLQTRQDGYRLHLDVDVAQARRLLSVARNGGEALTLLRQAHALWRGPVLADLVDVTPIATAVEGCARLHREVTDALITAAVDAGRADDVDGLSAAAHAADPLREQAVLLRMRVLAACGQAAEALRVGRDFRRRLADETGLDAGPALGALERDIAGGAAGPTPDRVPPPTRPTTRLFGREAQVAALHRLLASERMVTVVGPGGVGKTRVALEVAGQSDAATVLLLAPVTDPLALPHALAAALRLDVVRGDVLAACVAVLGDRAGLLVVDNCEHLLDAVRTTVEMILTACPQLSVLATSREPVGAAVEYAYRLPPLALPATGPDPSGVPSVAVFVDRARRVRPGPAPTPADLRIVADIVRRLDGLPLAIELAAGRLSTFSLADLAARLDRALDLLGDRASAEARHRTLRASVEGSSDLFGPV
jgi:predicted ATPase